MSEQAWKFWVDRGGTFTDLIGCDPTGTLHIRKVLSEGGEGDPAVQAMRELLGIPSGEPIRSHRLRASGWGPPLPRMPCWSVVVHRWCCSPTVVWLICCASGINIALISLPSSSLNAHFWPARWSKFRAVWMPMALSWSRPSGTTTYATVSRRFGPVVLRMWWWRCCMPTATPPTSCSVSTN